MESGIVSIPLPGEVYAQLKAVAEAEQTTPAMVIKRMLEDSQLGKPDDDNQENGHERVYRSAQEILNLAPGQRVFTSAEEVQHYLSEERASWGS